MVMLSGLNSDMLNIIIMSILGVIFVFFLIAIINLSRERAKANDYAADFERYFSDTKDIRKTLEHILAKCPPKSQQAKAITSALMYLDTSIIKDYKEALKYVEKMFNSKIVDKAHHKCLAELHQLRVYRLEEEED